MSEAMPESAPEAQDNNTAEPEPFDPERAQAKIKKANEEARSLRQRLKDLEPLAQEAERRREESKTAEQRWAEQLTAIERRAAEAETRALRLEVAADKGLTPAQAKRLSGSTREELEADAEELLATFGPPTEPRLVPLDLGSRGAPATGGPDMNQLIRRGLRRG